MHNKIYNYIYIIFYSSVVKCLFCNLIPSVEILGKQERFDVKVIFSVFQKKKISRNFLITTFFLLSSTLHFLIFHFIFKDFLFFSSSFFFLHCKVQITKI